MTAKDARNSLIDTPVCHRPLHVSEVDADGVHLVARPGLRFRVVEAGDELLMVNEPRLGIQVIASTRRELQGSLERALGGLWREQVNTAHSPHSAADWRVRAVLLALFKPF